MLPPEYATLDFRSISTAKYLFRAFIHFQTHLSSFFQMLYCMNYFEEISESWCWRSPEVVVNCDEQCIEGSGIGMREER